MSWWAHDTSTISETAQIGDGTRIWQFCNVMDGASIGCNCNLGQNVFVENGVKIGDRVKVKNNISLYTGVICEDDVFLGPNCVFTNVMTPRSFVERKSEFKQTVLKKGCSIGANATIICGNTIGEYAMVGAGAVVTKDVRPYELVVGNPARRLGYVCECGERLDEGNQVMKCVRCGKTYEKTAEDKVKVIEGGQ